MAEFIPGLELVQAFYREVLGFDTARSTDHSWGPRAQIFVETAAVESLKARIDAQLPETYQGWPVRRHRWQTNRVEHHVEVVTLHDWLQKQLGFDPRPSMTTAGWLAVPQQLLLEVTAGRVFHDDSGELTKVRDLLAWYPNDVWLWMMACQWDRLQNDQSYVGRTAELGDDLGSRLIAGHIVHNAVQLCFLQERRYAPYAKWLGSALAQLNAADEVRPLMHAVLGVADFPSRDDALVRLYATLARRHNALDITAPLSTASGPFEVGINQAVRPFRVLHADFGEACLEAIGDEQMRRLPTVGAIDQLTDPTDLLIHFTDWPRQLSAIYQRQLGELADSAGDRPHTDE